MAKVLILGSGGREHALGWKMAQSEQVTEVLFAPGNGGTAVGKGRNIPLDGQVKHWEALAKLIQQEQIALTVVGPEAPLAAGLVDFLQSRGLTRVFGPSQAAAQLEADKFFSYKMMEKLNIPQACGVCCTSMAAAKEAIQTLASGRGIVLKVRGLAGGKGVVVCHTRAEAMERLPLLVDTFGSEILVAERLSGPEFSVFGISDGSRVRLIEIGLQDHKPLYDGDVGPNTGGMGAYGPAPLVSSTMIRHIADSVMTPIVREFKAQGTPYTGFLYAGLILTEQGPKVLEFNVRFGDPECQPTMCLLKDDLYEVLTRSFDVNSAFAKLSFLPGAACCVILSSQGYPGPIKKGLPVSGLDDAAKLPGVQIFHSGTKRVGDRIETAGGRVLSVTAYAPSGLVEATKRAYEAVASISIEGGFHFRTDIAAKAVS